MAAPLTRSFFAGAVPFVFPSIGQKCELHAYSDAFPFALGAGRSGDPGGAGAAREGQKSTHQGTEKDTQ